ncbi:MAG: hypothetical protein ACOX8W_07520 [bacterium]|jgi:hypothetical protein
MDDMKIIDGKAGAIGPCPPKPKPKPETETVCIEVVKVYDSCFQCECIEDLTVTPEDGQPAPVSVLSANAVVCSFDCVFGEDLNIPGLPGRRRITFTWVVEVTIEYLATDGSTQTVVATFTFTKDVPLYVAPGFESLMFCKFFANFEILRIRIVNGSIVFDLGMSLLFKTAADVQLLVPAFGFCVPPRCREIPTACEDFIFRCETEPPNFNPPQPEPIENDD